MSSERKDYPQVVTVANLKGGVGKTTLCVNLSYGLSYFLDKRVLLVDLDPQANATQYLLSQQTYRKVYLSPEPVKKTIMEVYDEFYTANRQDPCAPLKDSKTYLQRVYKGSEGYLDLLASKLELGLRAFEIAQFPKFNQVRWFIEGVSSLYDVVLIDCPPTVSNMLIAGLEAAQTVLIPIKPDFLSTIGLPLLHRTIVKTYPDFVKRADWLPPLKILGLVYTMVNLTLRMTQYSMRDVEREAKKLGYNIFESMLSHSTKFSWSSKLTLPVFRSEPSSRYAKEVEALVDEFSNLLEENDGT